VSVTAIHVQIINDPDGWRLGLALVNQEKGKAQKIRPIVGTTHGRTAVRYATPTDALVSAKHLVREILGEAPAGVPGKVVEG
jgi:hypothetical protein